METWTLRSHIANLKVASLFCWEMDKVVLEVLRISESLGTAPNHWLLLTLMKTATSIWL